MQQQIQDFDKLLLNNDDFTLYNQTFGSDLDSHLSCYEAVELCLYYFAKQKIKSKDFVYKRSKLTFDEDGIYIIKLSLPYHYLAIVKDNDKYHLYQAYRDVIHSYPLLPSCQIDIDTFMTSINNYTQNDFMNSILNIGPRYKWFHYKKI